MADFRWVLPGKLRLSPTRPEGADDYKLAMQEVDYGSSTKGMPPIEVIAGADAEDKQIKSSRDRSEVLNVLDQLMQEHPGWRLGQLVTNIAFLARQSDTATWDMENEEFLEAARAHLQRIAERRAAVMTQEPAMREKVAA